VTKLNRSSFAILILAIFAGILCAGCAGTTIRVPVGDEVVHDPTSITVQDYETVAQKMARSMISLPQIQNAQNSPTIAFIEVKNRSGDYIDTHAFLEKMRTLFVKYGNGKMTFLDRENLGILKQEVEDKQAGDLTTSGDAAFLGADFFLTGIISTIYTGKGAESTLFRRFSFRLVDARTSAIIWEDEYESQYYRKLSDRNR